MIKALRRRFLPAVLGLLALGALPGARAQPAETTSSVVDTASGMVWSEPDGRYELRVDRAIWSVTDPASEGDVVLIQNLHDNGADTFNRCVVRQRPLTVVSELNQIKLNSYIEAAYSEAQAQSFFHPARSVRVAKRRVDDIVVADIELIADTDGPDFRVHYHIFALAGRDGATYHEVRCAIVMPYEPGDEQEGDLLIASLHFVNGVDQK
jgi:hypothetical protein